MFRLRAMPNPTRTDFEIAARSLDLIRTLDPTDTDLLRRSIEAWAAAGDPDTEVARTRELLALDPTDTVAQLRLAIEGLSRAQTADERLDAYTRLLGDRGRALDPAVRSRLAVDAALLARDNSDDALSLEYLTLATTLDPTNKEAAALYAGNLLQLTSDPFDRVDLLSNIILSDPLDPSTYENLALELLQYGAYEGALRAFRLSTSINQQLGIQLTEDRIFDFALCEWNVAGPDVALTRLARVLQDTMLAEERRRAALEADGKDPGPRKEDLLPPRLQLLRLAIAASERTDTAKAALAALVENYLKASDIVLNRLDELLADTEQPLTDEQRVLATRRIREERLQRLWAQLTAGDPTHAPEQLEAAEAFIDELDAERAAAASAEADPDAPPPIAAEVLQRYRGWLYVKQGRDLDAESLLAPLVEKDHLARWAMGLLKDEQGITDEAARHFALLARDQTTTALGTAAYFRLTRLLDRPIVRSSTAQELDRRVMSLAPWLEDFVADPARFMSASVEVHPLRIDALERPLITISVRNTSRWPLGIGAGRPIPKRMLLAPRIRRAGRDASTAAGPLVAIFNSHLRLNPAETATLTIHPLREDFGRLLDNTAASRVDARWQLLQNFVADGEAYKASPLTITTQSDVLTRVPLDAEVGVENLIARMQNSTGAEALSDALLAGAMIGERSTRRALEDPTLADERRALAAALVARLPHLDPEVRTALLIRIAELGMHNDADFRAAIDTALEGKPDRFPLLAALLSMAWNPVDPIIDRAENADDPELSRIATLVRESLQQATGFTPPHAEPDPDAQPTDPGE